MSTIQAEYATRIEKLKANRSDATRLAKRLMVLRLITFVAAVTAFAALFEISAAAASAAGVGLLLLFGATAMADMLNQRRLTFIEKLIRINENELRALDGDISPFHNGQEFFDVKHPYSYDLDIFGEQSIYQLICRANTTDGRRALAHRLTAPIKEERIASNQVAVDELGQLTDWRQELMAATCADSSANIDISTLKQWICDNDVQLQSKGLLRFVNLYAYVPFVLLGATFLGLPFFLFLMSLIPQFILYGKYFGKIGALQNKVSRMDTELKGYAQLLAVIEKQEFNAPLLTSLKNSLRCHGRQPSAVVAEFAGLVAKLDYRNNFAFMATVGALMMWDIRISLKLIAWRKKYGSSVAKWMEVVGKMEAISSLATLRYNNPDWCQPQVTERYFTLSAEEVGHPLIPSSQRVSNTFGIPSTSCILLTGSNMAGKSTFLRTLGVNMVLAYAGAPVCAKAFEVSYVPIHTSMRITDSLVENTSSFYAEIKRLGEIVEAIKGGEKPFVMLDEVFRGTNSNDRHIGSKALIELLVSAEVCGIIATHDLALADAEQAHPQAVANYNFDVQVDENDELFFDYRIKRGICKSLNASILMRKIGLKV